MLLQICVGIGHNRLVSIDLEKLEWFRRNSCIGLNRKGEWTYNGSPVESARVQKLFHQGLKINQAGEAQLHVGKQWCYLEEVQDTLYFVDNLRLEGSEIVLRLLGGRQESLNSDSLSHGDEGRLCCVLQNGQRARFLRSAMSALSDYLVETDHGYNLNIGEESFAISEE
ncbi:MAG TPA: hypothetical protein EYN66_20350 [Myxococcales bacterium]|nr:hypothetical protein [Myxococcales bacterium]